MFDLKMTQQDNFKFNGVRDGMKWKTAVERYFISCAPVLMEILSWAERQEFDITVDVLQQAIGTKLVRQQVLDVNAQIWGFLSNLIAGSAETIFKRAKRLYGVDAWRRLVRHINKGSELHLDILKREMKNAMSRQMKILSGTEVGVADAEHANQAYIDGGGEAPKDK